MDRTPQEALAPSSTPRTDAAKFEITKLDVGSAAVRPGQMADLEERLKAILVAAHLIRARLIAVGGLTPEHDLILKAAISVGEMP